jgi:hypothetical protein
MRPAQENAQTLHSCQREHALLSKSANEILSSMKIFESQCHYLQMRTLSGFSNLTVRADSFTAESEHQDEFPAETLASSPSSSPKLNFSK